MINGFHGRYRFLSNFYDLRPHNAIIRVVGFDFWTAEHAYQASKCESWIDAAKIYGLDSPGKAKRAGRKCEIRSDWDKVKVDVMRDIIGLKFETPSLQELLLSTGSQEIVEVNTWGDVFWGVCRGNGQNMLGKILMEVRSGILRDYERRLTDAAQYPDESPGFQP